MKFYGNGNVWDKRNDKQLCEFVDGELETSDAYIINVLIEVGFKHDGEAPVIVDEPTEDVPAQISLEDVKAPEVPVPVKETKKISASKESRK